jgi:hypothetical protein
VRVFVAKVGDGFKVHDGGAAWREAWLHGRDEHVILSCLRKESSIYRLEMIDGALWANAKSADWLAAAILAVANGSAHAAIAAVMKTSAASEEAMLVKMEAVLSERFGKDSINAILPHHNSVASKYVSFADTESEGVHKFAVFERGLDLDDVALIQQVAELVPLVSLASGAKRALAHVN